MNFDWEPVCRSVGIGIISCHEGVEAVLSAIRGSDLVLADAMHGAIAADTMRVPWVAVTCNENILAAKWQDWLASLRLPYKPVHIEPLFDGNRGLDAPGRLKRLAKMALARVGSRSVPSPSLRPDSSKAQVDHAVAQLAQAARHRPQLSEASLLDRHVERYLARIQALRRERATGVPR
jgi:succinoglycan biosynthesis protein ExoV